MVIMLQFVSPELERHSGSDLESKFASRISSGKFENPSLRTRISSGKFEKVLERECTRTRISSGKLKKCLRE